MIFLNNKDIICIVGNKHNCVYTAKSGEYIQLLYTNVGCNFKETSGYFLIIKKIEK